MFEWIGQADWWMLHGIRQMLQCRTLDFLMPKITLLGNGGALWLLAALTMTISKRYRKYGVALFGALTLGFLIANVGLKPLVARARPCWLEDVALLIANPKDYSFPSGHTLSSVIGAVVLTAANRKWGFWAIPAAVSIAFSRLYLYVHFPSDVATSVVLGLLVGRAAVTVCRRLPHPRLQNE